MFNIPSITAPTSALRIGLLDLKPIEVSEKVKQFGLSIRRKFTIFEPTSSITDYYMTTNANIVNNIPIPARFEKEKLVTYLTEKMGSFINEDKDLSRILSIVKEKKHDVFVINDFVSEIITYFEANLNEYTRIEAKTFLESDLPLCYFADFVRFNKLNYAFLSHLNSRIKWYKLLCSTKEAKNNIRIYQNHFAQMKREFSPLLGQSDKAYISQSSLKLYILLQNSNNYEDIFEFKPLKMSNLNDKDLLELHSSYDQNLSILNGILYISDHSFMKEITNFAPPPTMLSSMLTVN